MEGVPHFGIRSAQAGTATVVACSGELDLYTAPELAAALEEALGAGARRVVVDLTGATFLDSSAIGVLLQHRARLGARFGTLALVCPDRAVLRALEVTGLDRLFAIHDDRAGALAVAAVDEGTTEPPEAYDGIVRDLEDAAAEAIATRITGDA